METTNLNECYIYFALTGNGFDPDKISTTLNLKATKIVREGSHIPGKIPVCSSWKYGTPLLRNGDVFRLGEIAEELISKGIDTATEDILSDIKKVIAESPNDQTKKNSDN